MTTCRDEVTVISKGRVVSLSREQINEVPKNCWFKYCQYRLTQSHEDVIAYLTRQR